MRMASTLALITIVALAQPLRPALAADELARGDAAAIAAAIASPDRPKADVEQDARRKPQQVLEFAGIATRYDGNRLPNVRQVTSSIEDLKLIPASLDAAIFVMSYHDLYWRPTDGSWPATDPMLLLARLYAALKAGGLLAHPDDDHSKLVFDDAIRGRTDQFLFRFRKPAR